jgi:fructose-1-phosphate kinase PfkB-like protein
MNVSRVLSQLGCEVVHLTQLGGRNKDWFLDEAAKIGVSVQYARTEAEIRTCTTLIETGAEPPVVTELVEDGNSVNMETEKELRSLFKEVLKTKPDAVVISGSKARGFSDRLYPDFAKESLCAGVPLIADYRGCDLLETLKVCKNNAGKGRFVVKINESEFCGTFAGQSALTREGIFAKMEEIFADCHCSLIVTRGEQPLFALDEKKRYEIEKYVLPDLHIQNTIGCGDSFAAGFTAEFVRTGDFEAALRVGSRCGALNAATIVPGSIK